MSSSSIYPFKSYQNNNSTSLVNGVDTQLTVYDGSSVLDNYGSLSNYFTESATSFTNKSGKALYCIISYRWGFAGAGNANGTYIQLWLRRSNSAVRYVGNGFPITTSDVPNASGSTPIVLAQGESISLWGWQNSGSTISYVIPQFSILVLNF